MPISIRILAISMDICVEIYRLPTPVSNVGSWKMIQTKVSEKNKTFFKKGRLKTCMIKYLYYEVYLIFYL